MNAKSLQISRNGGVEKSREAVLVDNDFIGELDNFFV